MAKGGQPAQRLNSLGESRMGAMGTVASKPIDCKPQPVGVFRGFFRRRFSSKMSSGNNEIQTLLTQGNTSTSGQSQGLEAAVLGSELERSLHHLRVFPAKLLASWGLSSSVSSI